ILTDSALAGKEPSDAQSVKDSFSQASATYSAVAGSPKVIGTGWYESRTRSARISASLIRAKWIPWLIAARGAADGGSIVETNVLPAEHTSLTADSFRHSSLGIRH